MWAESCGDERAEGSRIERLCQASDGSKLTGTFVVLRLPAQNMSGMCSNYLSQSLDGAVVRLAVPSTLPTVASVRQIFASGEVAVSATRPGVPGASLGNATPHETISLELSSTGLSFVSSDASAFRTDGVVGIFMSCLSVARGKARELRASPARR